MRDHALVRGLSDVYHRLAVHHLGVIVRTSFGAKFASSLAMQVLGRLPIRIRKQEVFGCEVASQEELLSVASAAKQSSCDMVRILAVNEDVADYLLSHGAKEIPVLWMSTDQVPETTNLECKLRLLTDGDLRPWSKSFLGFQQDQFQKLGMPPPCLQEDEIEQLFQGVLAESSIGMCAVSDTDEILGVAHASICRGGVAYLAEFWVMPTAQRKGVGRALLRRILSELAGRGVNTTKNFCIRSNLAACGFYESLRFHVLPHRCFALPVAELCRMASSDGDGQAEPKRQKLKLEERPA